MIKIEKLNEYPYIKLKHKKEEKKVERKKNVFVHMYVVNQKTNKR